MLFFLKKWQLRTKMRQKQVANLCFCFVLFWVCVNILKKEEKKQLCYLPILGLHYELMFEVDHSFKNISITPVNNHHEITSHNTLVRTFYPLLSSFCCLQTPSSFSSFPVRPALKLLVTSLKYHRYKPW